MDARGASRDADLERDRVLRWGTTTCGEGLLVDAIGCRRRLGDGTTCSIISSIENGTSGTSPSASGMTAGAPGDAER